MNIIFMGTPDFSVPVLQRIIADGHQVLAVVSQPDRPKGRKKILTPPPVKTAALELGLKVLQPESIKKQEAVEELLAYNPELIVTAAYGQILPESLLKVPPLGCINVHASLLPKYRGAAPIHQAIIDGERETGITIMYMVKALDAGDIISQQKVMIEEKETTGTLHDKLSAAGADLLSRTLLDIKEKTIQPVAQDDTEATYAPTLKREDEKINWQKSSKQIDQLIRGLHPFPGSYTIFRGQVLKIWKAAPVSLFLEGSLGELHQEESGRLFVSAGDQSALELLEVQPAGKKRMSAESFTRGYQVKKGERLG